MRIAHKAVLARLASLVILLIVMPFVASDAPAQQAPRPGQEAPLLWFGGYGGFHLNSHSVEFTNTAIGENCCPDFPDQEGNGIAFGLLVEMPLSDVLRLQLRAGLQGLGSDFTATAEDARRTTVISSNGDTSIVPIIVEQRLNADIATIAIEPTASYYVMPRLAVLGGLRASLVSTFDVAYEEGIAEPANVRFLDGSDTRANFSGELATKESFALSGVIGLSYDLPIAEQSSISPEIRYAVGLTDLASDGWKTNTFQAGLALKIALPSVGTTVLRDSTYIRDTSDNVIAGIITPTTRLVDTQVKQDTLERNFRVLIASTITETYVRDVPSREFNISIGDMRLLDANRNPLDAGKVAINQVDFVDNLPLLRYVFFDEGSGDLASTQLRLLGADETAGFDQNGLDSRDPLAVYPQVLNIVGARMRSNTSSRLTLTGCNSDEGAEQNNRDLSRRRAEAVRDYLVNTWGIAADRIDVQARNLPALPSNTSTEDGREENRRVEMSSNDLELLRSVSSKTFIYESDIHTLVGSLNVNADAGIDNWVMELKLKGELVANVMGTKESFGRIEWQIDPAKLMESNGEIDVELRARDRLGQELVENGTYAIDINTVQQKRSKKEADKAIERYLIAMFDYDQAEITAISRQEVVELGNNLRGRDFSVAEILGYTDRTGATDYNEQLAMRRAEQVLNLLKLPEDKTRLLPIGSRVLLFDNNHPVGRFYSRTVEVRVELDI